MAEVGSAFISLMPSARGFGRATERQISGEMRSSGSRLGATMGRALLIGGTAAIGAGFVAAKVLKGAIDEATEAAVVTARTQNVIKSMGGAANVTAKQVAKLSQSISNKVGIDDEAIQTGQNMLLTFRQVRNEVGKGNDIFTQASGLMVDMSKAMGKDMQSSAIMLGKALNDPVAGVTALGRAGVQFTTDQKETIKSLVETGDVLDAQKIILGEVTDQFGGAAEAMATPAEKAEVAWANLKEQLGTQLLPTFNKVATFLTTDIIPAVSQFIRQMGNGKGAGGDFANVMGDIGNAVKVAAGFLRNDWLPMLVAFWGWLNSNIIPGLKVFATRLGEGLKGAFDNINKAIQDNRPFIDQLLVALKAVGRFIGTVVLPAMGAWAKVYFPALGKAIGIGITAMRLITQVVLAFVVIGSRAFRLFLQVVMATFGNIIKGAAAAFGWMPEIGGKVKAANAAFQSLGNQAVSDLQRIESQARAMGAALDNATRSRTVYITTHVTTLHDDVYGGLGGFGGRTPNETAGKPIAPSGVTPKMALDDDTIGKLGKVISGDKGRALLAARRAG